MIKNLSLALILGTLVVAEAANDSASIGGGAAGWNWAQNV